MASTKQASGDHNSDDSDSLEAADNATSSGTADLIIKRAALVKKGHVAMLAWITGHLVLAIASAVGVIVIVVLVIAAVAGAFDGGNNQQASADSGRCPNGNLLANNCQPATSTGDEGKTSAPAPQTSSQPPLKGTGTKPAFVSESKQGSWNVHGTDRLAKNPVVDGWIRRLQDPAPRVWKTFPNIPNPDVSAFRVVNGTQVPDGVEYGTYSTPYCYAHPCDVPVGAWEYRLITGDYSVLGYECRGASGKGCLLLLINVMDQSVTFRNQDVDNGFTVRGRYWNGDALEWGVWGLVSHASANMLNLPTLAHPGEVLNSGDPGNSGANCGNPLGCGSVDARVIVVAGDAPIAVLETTVLR
ncbi:MAG: hypothetical protein AAB538_04570 [Patescibacteria group bacterium]